MCGIAGFFSRHKFDSLQASLEPAVSKLGHRGPDGRGCYTDAAHGLGLGHSRLAVIDLSETGQQPMASGDGHQCIVYNGEIYNFRQLREVLQNHGHVFRGGSDTEVVLCAYRQWGIDCLKRFVGMYAFALWDADAGCLFLARDRLGIKPLYYYLKDGTLLFASEIKALRAFEEFPAEIDPQALPLFLHYQYIPAPRSIYRHTWKLSPGHYLVFNGVSLTSHAYWQLPLPKNQKIKSELNDAQALQELKKHLSAAVSKRLVSDVPLGVLLSGGVDSSLVTAVMKTVAAGPVKTFSIGFDDPRFNEAPWAAQVARQIGTDHTELYVSSQMAIETVPEVCRIFDEPFANSSAIPTILLSRLARSHVTVALTGDGGDELFCGYTRYWASRFMMRRLARAPKALINTASFILKQIPVSWIEACYLPLERWLPERFRVANTTDKWQKLVEALGQTRLQDLYRMTICLWPPKEVALLAGRPLPGTGFERAFEGSRGLEALSRCMYADQQTYLPDDLLTKIDRASMAAGLEVRVPLLDQHLVAYSARLPERFKYRNGSGKYLLKKLLKSYLPVDVVDRPKQGFGVPLGAWLRHELKDMMRDYLSCERLKKEGLFEPHVVQQKIREHLNGTADHHHRLWALLVWQMWRERWA